MKNCKHLETFKIEHLLFNFKCKECGKRFIFKPTDYFELKIVVEEIKKKWK
jgi:hypothetical protein